MKKWYSFIVMIVIITLLTSATAFAGSKAPSIKVTVNNKIVKYDTQPYLKGGDVMISLQQTSEALGLKVETKKNSKTVWINLDMMHLELPIGKSEFYIHRDADFTGIPQTVKLQTPIKSIKGKVFVPGKAVFSSLGRTVKWDSKKRVLSIVNDKSTGVDLTKPIPYTVIAEEDIQKSKDIYKWYKANYKKAGIYYTKLDNVMYVLAGAGRKPTGGYSVNINKITYDTVTKGYVFASFTRPSPDMMVTQVETFPHMLIKIEGCKKLKSIDGEVQEIIIDTLPTQVPYDEITVEDIQDNDNLKNWYEDNNQKQGISSIRDGKYIYALIGAGEKPTGGYTLHIDNVFYSTVDTVTVNARVTPPGDNVRVMMVITYPSTLIRIESDTVKTVVGEVLDTEIAGKEKWITMDSSTVTQMELFNLDQVKLRDITGAEKEDIMKSFNEAVLDPNPYVKMIAGNVLKVTTTDGYIVTFTSYGSETNAIVSLEKDGEARSFHIIAPFIAKTLLSI